MIFQRYDLRTLVHQTPKRLQLDDVSSPKYSSAWIEAKVEIVGSHSHRGPCAILNEILSGCLADAFHNGGVSNGLVDSEPDSTCEYRYAHAQ